MFAVYVCPGFLTIVYTRSLLIIGEQGHDKGNSSRRKTIAYRLQTAWLKQMCILIEPAFKTNKLQANKRDLQNEWNVVCWKVRPDLFETAPKYD